MVDCIEGKFIVSMGRKLTEEKDTHKLEVGARFVEEMFLMF